MLERDTEVTVLGRLLSKAAAGRGSVVAIEGPAGIGKTALLAHARQQASNAGWRVLDARCTPMSGTIGFCLFRDWFGTLAHRVGADAHPFDGPGQALSDLADGQSRSIGDLVYGARWVLESLTADEPVLLVVDDLQWADSSSLEALDLLLQALGQLACLVVVTVRTGEPTTAPGTLNRIMAASTLLSPQPLSRDAVAQEVRSHRAEATDAEVDEVHRTSGGVPFFVHELVAGDGGTPEAVVGSVAARLGRLSPTATATARAACVLGPEATIALVSQLTGHTMAGAADDIARLVEAQLISIDGGQLRAAHPLIADAVLAPLGPVDTSVLHGLAAAALVDVGASQAVVANHLLHTLPTGDPEARDRLAEEGRAALASGSIEVAARLLERALAECPPGPDDVELLSATARALAGLGRIDQALRHWERARALTDDEAVRDRIRAEAGDALMSAGRHGDAQAEFGSMSGNREGRPRLFVRMVMTGLLNGVSLDYLRDQVDEALARPPAGVTHDERLSLAATATVLAFGCQDADRARDLALRAIASGSLHDEEAADGALLFLSTGVLAWTSALAEGESLLTTAVDDARAHNAPMAHASATACRAGFRARMGMISEALADIETALAQRSLGWHDCLAPLLATLVDCLIARGELDRAADLQDELEDLAHSPGVGGAFATFALAELAAARGDHEAASHLYSQVGRMVEGRMDNPSILPWRAGLALCLIRTGHPREAVELARTSVDRARMFGSPYAIAHTLRVLAAVDATGDRVAMLREALDVLRGVPAPRLEAQCATDLAGMLLLNHGMTETAEPVALLRRAESYAAFQELRPLTDRVQRLLQRIGEPVRRSAVQSLGSLTVSERRVADLAAAGLSNRQIAQQLFVTVKAVEWHLSNVYRKLGIRSRTRLPGLLNVPQQRVMGSGQVAQRAG